MIRLYNITNSTVTRLTSPAMDNGKSISVDVGPVVTYVSVTYVTATDVPVVVTTDVTITLTTSDSVPTDTGTSSASPLSITTAPASPTGESTSYSSVHSTSTISDFTTSSSANSASPGSTTLGASTANATSILSMQASSSSSISRGGVIGIAVVPVILFVALIVLWRYYRRQKKSHKEALLIAPRPSNFNDFRFFEMRHKPFIGHGSGGDGLDREIMDTNLGAVHTESPLYKSLASLGHTASSTEREHTSGCQPVPGTSDRLPWTADSSGVLTALPREHKSLESNIYGIRYNPDGTLALDYGPTRYAGPRDDRWSEALQRLNALHLGPTDHTGPTDRVGPAFYQTPPRWDEALQGLNTLRKQLSPPPLRIVKRSASNPEHEIQPPARALRHPMRSDLESNAETYQFNSLTERDRLRALALAKLEGRYSDLRLRYKSDSVYSRTSDGTLINGPGDPEGRPHWKKLESLWPDGDGIPEETMDKEE